MLSKMRATDIGRFIHPVGECGPGYLQQNLLYPGIVQAQHCKTVEGKLMEKLHKTLAQAPEIAAVGSHMIAIDTCQHRNNRLKTQERAIALIRLGYEVLTSTKARMGSGARELPPNNERGVQASFCKKTSNEACCRGLTMRPRDGNTLAETHQFRQHFSARHDRDALPTGGDQFRIFGRHGAGGHYHIGSVHIVRIVPNQHSHPEFPQALRHCIVLQVRTRHIVAQRVQYLGNASHAGPADTDKMDTPHAAHAMTVGINHR